MSSLLKLPINGPYKITQRFKNLIHDGLDIVSFYDNNIYSPISGVVTYAGWENPSNKKQGFGLYVRIRDVRDYVFYFGHLSKISVKTGDNISVGDCIGVIGNTGKSTGIHLHYCCRFDGLKSDPINVAHLHSIDNKEGLYNQFVVKKSWKGQLITKTPYISTARKIAKSRNAVIYDEKGKTLFSYR